MNAKSHCHDSTLAGVWPTQNLYDGTQAGQVPEGDFRLR